MKTGYYFVKYRCKMCGKTFGLRRGVRRHLREEHFVKEGLSQHIDKLRAKIVKMEG